MFYQTTKIYYFLNIEKRNKARCFLKQVFVSNKTISTDPDELLLGIRNFYSDLYKRRSTKTEEDCYLANFSLPGLRESERAVCEGKLTKQECWEALVSMGNDKSLGNDGFIKESHVCFFDVIHKYLIELLNSSFPSGKLSNSQRQVVITAIEKKGKDKRHL